MPRKSKQHIVPRVHLRAFADSERPSDHPVEAPFTPSVWLHERDFSGRPIRKAPANVLFQRNAYTLRSDDPEEPVIEEWLAQLENQYARVQEKLIARADISPEEWGEVFHFVGALHARTPKQVALWQRQFGELEQLTRMVERAHTGHELDSDRRFRGWEEIGLRTLQDRAVSFVEVMRAGSIYILENRSSIPFITSDTPVFTTHSFANTLVEWGVPRELVADDESYPRRKFVCFCALTPDLAVLASHLFRPEGELHWWRTDDLRLISSLVFQQVVDADSIVICASESPFPDPISRAFAKGLEMARCTEAEVDFVRLFTPTMQFQLRVESLELEMNGPFGLIRFRTNDLEQLKNAAQHGRFVDVHYGSSGTESSGMMRNAHFTSVSLDPTAESVLEQTG